MPEINLGLAASLLDKIRYNTGVARGSLTPQGTKASDPVLEWFSRNNYKKATAAFNGGGWTSSSLNSADAGPAYPQVNFQQSQYTIATNNLTEQENAIGGNATGVFRPTRHQAIMDTYMPGRYRDEPNVGRRRGEIDVRIFCLAVVDENDGQLPGDRPSAFVSTYTENFPGVTFYHQYINFLPLGSTQFTLLEPVDNITTFGYNQPRVDGYDWYSRLEGDIGVTLDPELDIILYCIDESGSMDKESVQVSLALFISKTSEFAIPVLDIEMAPAENMYLPFMREDVISYVRQTLESLDVIL
jgi:hypothetical protein